MKIKKIFRATAIGEPHSPERMHADAMNGEVLKKIEDDSGYSFITASSEPAIGSVMESIIGMIKDVDVVIADMRFENLNVYYEVGLAHALKKHVIFLCPEGTRPPFDVANLAYILYDKDFALKDRSYLAGRLINDLKNTLKKLETASEDELSGYLAYPNILKDIPTTATEDMLSKILSEISNLEGLVTMGTQNQNMVSGELIKGEDEVFKEMAKAVENAEKSIRTTRFSPKTVMGRQNEFFDLICDIIKQKERRGILINECHRIISPNDEKKLKEVTSIVKSNLGHNFTVHLSQHAYSFETAIIDKKIAFVNFTKEGNLASASLKFTNPTIARYFAEIFDNILKSSYHTISCKDISIYDNAVEEDIKKKFYEGLN